MTLLYGLVLAGGKSSRMGEDKAALSYHGVPQLEAAFDLVKPFVAQCFVSVRADQKGDALRGRFDQIIDTVDIEGPSAGLLSAYEQYPDVAWLVLACDLPMVDRGTLETLISARDAQCSAVAYRSEYDGLPEPLCAIWEPNALMGLAQQVKGGKTCPRKLLLNNHTLIIDPPKAGALDNINTPQERLRIQNRVK
ncbi:NTP transferase domain-containing protein [Swingsia samuiensis]|uniref:Molybdenum cofactor guanylyltransferase n=1 Tax=Swingsia samuiensis TaxID=1293412 RepID=A0A4Y6UIB2_9PROT|nr:NTP transferase domain-containing protein [Swingsia samuiensis]QDH17339.1 molybdenum cofactor guanylyltransferase [Swingsia samuiensis]